MKSTVPQDLQQDLPRTAWEKILSATPVVMTVVATLLAGLASSEMTRAQYDRALGAQLQSKAGDQWGYFQAKKMRGAIQRTTLDLLRVNSEIRPLDVARLPPGSDPAVLAALQKGTVVPGEPDVPLDARVKRAIEAVEGSRPEGEIAAGLEGIPDEVLAGALSTARKRGVAFDTAIQPVNDAIDRLEESFQSSDPAFRRDFAFARIRHSAARYDVEARLNQAIANLLELQVRQTNLSAERHHRRSGNFFFGMLVAQAAVILSTMAMAARQRSFLWTVAAIAGLAAVGFAIYVYVGM